MQFVLKSGKVDFDQVQMVKFKNFIKKIRKRLKNTIQENTVFQSCNRLHMLCYRYST